MTLGTKRKVTLECEHIVWLYPMPRSDEHLWCVRCRLMQPQALSQHGQVLEEGWLSTKTGTKWTGECVWTGDKCGFSHTSRNWYTVRDAIDKHIMREHVQSRFASTLVIVTEPLHKDAPPPF